MRGPILGEGYTFPNKKGFRKKLKPHGDMGLQLL